MKKHCPTQHTRRCAQGSIRGGRPLKSAHRRWWQQWHTDLVQGVNAAASALLVRHISSAARVVGVDVARLITGLPRLGAVLVAAREGGVVGAVRVVPDALCIRAARTRGVQALHPVGHAALDTSTRMPSANRKGTDRTGTVPHGATRQHKTTFCNTNANANATSVVVCCVALCCVVVCCYVVLCCIVLCCGVLCCVVLCCGVLLCSVVLCCVVLWCVVLCCVVLCCVVLCCVVLCCVVLCCVVLCCVVLCCVVLCCVVLCCVVLCCVVLCCVALRCVALRCVALRCVVLCCVVLCCVVLCCVVLCCAVLCCVVLCCVVLCCVVLCCVVLCCVVLCCVVPEGSCGVAEAPTYTPQNDPHDALIIWGGGGYMGALCSNKTVPGAALQPSAESITGPQAAVF